MKFTEGKPLLFGGVTIIVLLIGVASYWLLIPGKEVLFRELTPEEVDNVSAELTVLSIEHSIDRSRGTISVEQKDVARAKQVVMGSGNAFRDVVGFELFNKSDFGITDFAQRVNYQRALEGELSRTIGSLDDIRHARVHLVLPEKKLFSSEEEKVSVSIIVYLEPGKTLAPMQVDGIKKMIETSVPKLDTESIAIVNQSGKVLSGGEVSADYTRDRPLQEKMRVEDYLLEKVTSILDGSLGDSNYVAHVDVALDMDRKTVQTERLLVPEAGEGISEIRETESSGTGENAGKRSKSKEVSYQYGREVSSVEYSGYQIVGVNVGVVVDQSLESVNAKDLKELIQSVLGMQPDRGDRVTVIKNNIALKKAFEKVEQEPSPVPHPVAQGALPTDNQKILLLIAVVIGLLTLLLVLRMISDRLRYRRISKQLHQWVEVPGNVVQLND